MTAGEFRDKLIERIDALLGRPLLVWGDDRRLLSAVRGYLDVMPEVELVRMQGFYHERGIIMAHQLTAAQQAQAKALGIDLGKIDWGKVLQLIQFLVQLFGQPTPAPAPGPMLAAAGPDRKALLKAAGCSDDECDHACACLDAACLALQSAQLSLTCCNDCCQE